MCDSIVTVIRINRGDSSRPTRLADDVIGNDLGEGPIIRHSVPFAVNFFRHQIELPSIPKHPYTVDLLISTIKVCFHEQNGTELGNQGASEQFL